MQKGTVTVSDGMVAQVRTRGEEIRHAVTHQPLHDALKMLEAEGWRVDGALPPHTTSGRYTINIVKDKARQTVTG